MEILSKNPTNIEQHTIYQIPENQRRGRTMDLFTIWFGSGIMMLNIMTGALAITVFKLSFVIAVASIAVGNLVGPIFMALHAAQGPRLGILQMVQTRGQFDSISAVLVNAIVVNIYFGCLASNIVRGGQSLNTIIPGISQHVFLVMIAVISVVATIFGHDLIHAGARVVTWPSGFALLLSFVWITFVHGLPANFMTVNRYTTDRNGMNFLGLSRLAGPDAKIDKMADDNDSLLIAQVRHKTVQAFAAIYPYDRDSRRELYKVVV